ncbi:hypothetical protein ACFVMC_19040 [Nocardia sp. NPDC127579]|uniref:hypothetical protein n=1 Tax=Nocardia sp. NPDC127579 TaxID=3345402 RepID=UPI00363288A5
MTYPPGSGGGPYPQRDPDRWGQEPEWVAWPEDLVKVPEAQAFSTLPEMMPLVEPVVAATETTVPEAESSRGPGRYIATALAALLLVIAGSAYFLFTGDRTPVAPQAGEPSTSAAPRLSSPVQPVPVDPGDRFSYTEFAGAWDFKFGNVELHADWVTGADYDSCHDIEASAKLSALGCQYASELVYSAHNGGLMLTQFVLTMPDDAAAKAAEDKFTGKDLKLRPGAYVANYAIGKWKTEARRNFIVVTVGTATAAVPEAEVDKFLRYRHTDTALALMFR